MERNYVLHGGRHRGVAWIVVVGVSHLDEFHKAQAKIELPQSPRDNYEGR